MKILVVHPAQQHSYRLASALAEEGLLYKYITTVYYKQGSLTALAAHFLPSRYKTKARQRRCAELSDEQIQQLCEFEGLLKLLTMNVPALRPFYRNVKYRTSDHFAKKAAEYAIKVGADAVVGYDDYSSLMFEILAHRAPNILRILDVSAANTIYMRQIYERDMELQPEFAARLRSERKIIWDPATIERTKKELKYSQLFISPSDFVSKSLVYSGISSDRIMLCPYGVDTGLFAAKEYPTVAELCSRPLRFIYVGGVKELKGISYLLQAFDKIPENKAALTIVGQVNKTDEDIQPYIQRVTFTGSVLHSKIPELLHDADVYIFPSLGEGMSLSILEAAACGLPLIVSENSGVSGLMTKGVEGFTIPIQSVDAIVDKINWFSENRNKIEAMGKAAREFALKYSWERYAWNISEIFDGIKNG